MLVAQPLAIDSYKVTRPSLFIKVVSVHHHTSIHSSHSVACHRSRDESNQPSLAPCDRLPTRSISNKHSQHEVYSAPNGVLPHDACGAASDPWHEVVGAATQPAVKVSLERVGGYAERATNKVYNEAERHGSDFYRGTTDRFRDSVQITDKDRQNAREGRPLVSSSWGGSRW
jgi:hypothetical protein